MLQYHDREWGVPVHNDRKHFEFLVLEAAHESGNHSKPDENRIGGTQRARFSQFRKS